MTEAHSYQMTSGGGNARSLGEILKAFCLACTSMTDPCLGLRRMNGRSGMGGEMSQSPGSSAEWQPTTRLLTVDGDIHLLLLAVFPAADVARVRAPVRVLEPGDGQDVVEQHVRGVFHQPLGGVATVVDLQTSRRRF